MEPKYIEYLNSPEWRIIREQRLTKDRYTCRACGSTKNLQVHHLSYSNIYHEKMEDLITLCQECHSSFHKEKNDVKAAQEAKRKEKFDKAMKGNEENLEKLYEDMKKLKIINIDELLSYINPILGKIKSSPTYAIGKILDLMEEHNIYTIEGYNDVFAKKYNLLPCDKYTCLTNNFICHVLKEDLEHIGKTRTMIVSYIYKVWMHNRGEDCSWDGRLAKNQGRIKIRLWEEKGLTEKENSKFSEMMEISKIHNKLLTLEYIKELRYYYSLIEEAHKTCIDRDLHFLGMENMLKVEEKDLETEYNNYVIKMEEFNNIWKNSQNRRFLQIQENLQNRKISPLQ